MRDGQGRIIVFRDHMKFIPESSKRIVTHMRHPRTGFKLTVVSPSKGSFGYHVMWFMGLGYEIVK